MEGPNNERVSKRYDDVRDLKRRFFYFPNTNSIEQVNSRFIVKALVRLVFSEKKIIVLETQFMVFHVSFFK